MGIVAYVAGKHGIIGLARLLPGCVLKKPRLLPGRPSLSMKAGWQVRRDIEVYVLIEQGGD